MIFAGVLKAGHYGFSEASGKTFFFDFYKYFSVFYKTFFTGAMSFYHKTHRVMIQQKKRGKNNDKTKKLRFRRGH